MILPRYSSCVLDHRYFLGNFRDYSGNSNHGTTTTANWENRESKMMRFSKSDYVQVADSAELQLTTGTFIVYGDIVSSTSNNRILAKEDGGGLNYGLGIASATALRFYNDGAISDATVNYDGAKSIGVTFNTGAVPDFYKNGVLTAVGSASITLTADDAPLQIGNRRAGDVNGIGFPIKGVLIYNVILTAAEIAQVHEWIMNTRTPYYPKRNFVFPSLITGKENNVRSAWDMKNIHGSIIDKTGGGANGTISKCSQTTIAGLDALDFDDTNGSVINLGSNFAMLGKSVSILIKPSAFSTYDTVWTNNNHPTQRAGMQITTFGNIHASVYGGSVYISAPSDASLIAGNIYHLVAVYTDYDTVPTLYVNGVLQVTAAAASGALNSSGHFIGARDANFNQPYGGAIAEPIEFDSVLTQAEVSVLYEKYAKLPYFLDDLKDANESIAAEGGAIGGFLSNTEWRFGDTGARYKVSVDTVDGDPYTKVIECTTAGLLYQESLQAYGTWEFDMYKGGSSAFEVTFMATVLGSRGASGQASYTFRAPATEQLALTLNNATQIMFTPVNYIAAATWYKIRFTRHYDGSWTSYVKGGAFTSWTVWDVSGGGGTNPTTENTNKTSKYLVLDIDAGDRIANFRFYQGVLTP